jgi:hypothetical protein
MNAILTIPSNNYDFTRINRIVTTEEVSRAERLIHGALNLMKKPTAYELNSKCYNYGIGGAEAGTHYCLNYHLSDEICVVSATQRDVVYPFAFFPLSKKNAAAEYFVWLVGCGEVEIDWST